MKIGDIDVTNSILNLEYDVMVLKELLNHILNNNQNLNKPSQKEIEIFQEKALHTLNKKYPNMGVKKM